MEVYTLDDQLRRITVTDQFTSMIWTERFSSLGDFELVVHSTPENRQLFVVDTLIAINESYRVMVVDSVEDKIDNDGKYLLEVKGSSLEKVLIDRVAIDALRGLVNSTKWTLQGTPGNIARTIFKRICIDGTLSLADRIPYIQPGVLFPSGTISEPDTQVTVEFEPTTVYDALKQICDVYSLGFRLVRNMDQSELYFEVYSGNNRTTSQSSLAPVVFSPNLDNLTNITEYKSVADYKNVAYVFGKNGWAIVYAAGATPGTVGFKRHVLQVNANDIDLDAGAELDQALQQRGLEELAKHRAVSAFDGETPQNSSYRYGTDYLLGDLLEMQNIDGQANYMRVTEQIFVSDEQGERSYPTLTVDLYIQPGSWASWDANQTWAQANYTWDQA